MEDVAPSLDQLLRRDLSCVDDADVRLFLDYFAEMKRYVRKYLGYKAQHFPGDSAIAASALFSLFCDVTFAKVPLSDVDADGYPALWPLLLAYLERHGNKWNKYYRAKKRKAGVVSLSAVDSSVPGIDPVDHRSPADEEKAISEALEALYARLTPRQRRVADLAAAGRRSIEIAAELHCSQSLVELEKQKIRKTLATA